MKHKVLFACPKSTKRTKRGRDSSFELLPHTRLSRRKQCVASECGRWAKQKDKVCLSPWLSLYHACEHITRSSRADSRMRKSTPAYKGVAGVHEVCTLTEPRRWARFGKVGTPAASAWHRAKSSRQPVHLSLHFCLCPRSDGSLDMFAQEGIYCSRFGRWEMTGRFLRGNLLDDFWYFWSRKST